MTRTIQNTLNAVKHLLEAVAYSRCCQKEGVWAGDGGDGGGGGGGEGGSVVAAEWQQRGLTSTTAATILVRAAVCRGNCGDGGMVRGLVQGGRKEEGLGGCSLVI